jgi:uncharacterized peroxidase-related enzyme
MPHILPQPIPGVDPALSPALAEIETKTGPSNFFRLMAHRPEAMESFFRFYRTVMAGPGSIDQRLREMLYIAVSNVNECSYCEEHHSRTARSGASLTDREINEIKTEQNQHFSAREQAALQYARELTRTVFVDNDLRYRMQELFTPEQSVEITMVVGLANFTNRFNNGLAVSIED